ncbi:MAG: hypothetical protein AAF514_23950, partial [Verrucomicrobiota bacterium]
MIERQLEEQAGLYVLDLLEPDERLAFESRIREMPELRVVVREMEDCVSGVSLTAPCLEADPSNLEIIQRRLGTEKGGRSSEEGVLAKILRFPGGWPVAACLTALLGFSLFRMSQLSQVVAELE